MEGFTQNVMMAMNVIDVERDNVIDFERHR